MSYFNSDIRSENVMTAAREVIGGKRDLRVMRAERSESGWRLKYVALDDDYPVAAIERSLSRLVGEAVRMINLHYDFDTSARLSYASAA